ncbi:MAG TPA: hypothetical protein VGK11_01995 [Actinomycetota bacterium]
MIKVIAKYMVFMLLVSGLVTVPYAVPAAAHTGSCTVTGNTWGPSFPNGGTLYGSGNVDCGVVHSKMYIKVTLQEETAYGWVALSGTSKEKTLYNVPSIYKQTSYTCQSAPLGWLTYRVRIIYKAWSNGHLDHSDTVYKGQDRFWCSE